jgi:hypothetical protein
VEKIRRAPFAVGTSGGFGRSVPWKRLPSNKEVAGPSEPRRFGSRKT